jgi:hypothetical protein
MFNSLKNNLSFLKTADNPFAFILNTNLEKFKRRIWQESLPNLSFYVISQACFDKA